MIRLAILLVLITCAELGDGYIATEPVPVIVAEFGVIQDWSYGEIWNERSYTK